MIFLTLALSILAFLISIYEVTSSSSSYNIREISDITDPAGTSSSLQTSANHAVVPLHLVNAERDVQAKIIGGSNVPLGMYPWFARTTLYNHSTWQGCGGMLVAPEFVLTAAHCFPDQKKFLKRRGGYQIGALCTPELSSKNCGQKNDKILVCHIITHSA